MGSSTSGVLAETSVIELVTRLKSAKRIVLHFEPTPIDWWHKDFTTYSVSFCYEKGRADVLPLYHLESPLPDYKIKAFFRAVKDVMTSPSVEKVMHNSLFDSLAWYRVAGYMPYTSFDTMVCAHLLDENQFKSLKWLGGAYLGWTSWDIDAKKYHPLLDLAPYNAYDSCATWELCDLEQQRLHEDPRLEAYYYRMLAPMIRNLEQMVMHGVYVDRHELADQLWRNHKRIAEAAALIPVENPGSPQQIARWLYEVEGLPVVKRTETGAPSSDEETINRLAQRFPQAKNVLHYRHPRKMEGTYLRPPAQAMRDSFDGRPHPEIRTTVARTGRLSGGHHTTPRPDYDDPGSINPRYIYTAPPGWTHIAADINQGESRLVAWAAAGYPTTLDGATGMLAAWADRTRDVYVETAAYNLGIEIEGQSYGTKAISKKGRQEMGKVPVLAMQYDISPKGLREYAWSEYELEW